MKYYVLKIDVFKYNLYGEYDLKTQKFNFLVELIMSNYFILLLTYIKWKQIPRYFSCLFKIRHFCCSKDWCPDICLTWWPCGSETKDGYDSVCMLNGKRTEQNKIIKHLIWFSAALNTLNVSQFTEFWNVVGIKPEIICMLKIVVEIINDINSLFILVRICWSFWITQLNLPVDTDNRICLFSRWYFMIIFISLKSH